MIRNRRLPSDAAGRAAGGTATHRRRRWAPPPPGVSKSGGTRPSADLTPRRPSPVQPARERREEDVFQGTHARGGCEGVELLTDSRVIGETPRREHVSHEGYDTLQSARGSNHECRSARQQLRSTYVETDHGKTAAQRLNDNETCLLMHARKKEDVSVRSHHVKHSIVGQPPHEADAMIDIQMVSEAAEARFIGPAANHDESPSFRRGDSSDRDRYSLQWEQSSYEQSCGGTIDRLLVSTDRGS